MNDWLILTKARITAMVLVTTATGYVLGATQIHVGTLASLLFGVGLASAGAAALNQVYERDADARMTRTASRPVPSGRISPTRGLAAGLLLSAGGVGWLVVGINGLTGFLALLTIVLYIAVYTPLKPRTSLNTLVGAIPGAIPPVLGWTAATGSVGLGGWAMFSILFLWQLPHFLAIAWMFRDDYARGGFPMLPVVDPAGGSTGRQAALYALALIPASLTPTLLGLTGGVYFVGALALGLAFLVCGLGMALDRGPKGARRLLLASVTYLPLLLALLVLDRVAV